MDTSPENKPNLYHNFPLPLNDLSSDNFESFVYQSLSKLSTEKRFVMQSGPQGAGDEGFDCTAKEIDTGDLICIQCKRYSDTLYTNTVSEELVKAALNGILDDATPKQHYIITSGKVSNKLRKQLRQRDFKDLKNSCEQLIIGGSSLVNLIKKVRKSSLEPIQVVRNYINNLNSLIVWSGVDFQNELIGIWSNLSDILEQHFSLSVIFKEHPRPDFNASNYLKNKVQSNDELVPLNFQNAPLPNNLFVEEKLCESNKLLWSTECLLSSLKEGKNLLISSIGGSGKSSSLSIIEMRLKESFTDELFLPIRINLRGYSRGSLKQRIEQKLGINYGSWSSLPFKFIFLFDALDEMLL